MAAVAAGLAGLAKAKAKSPRERKEEKKESLHSARLGCFIILSLLPWLEPQAGQAGKRPHGQCREEGEAVTKRSSKKGLLESL